MPLQCHTVLDLGTEHLRVCGRGRQGMNVARMNMSHGDHKSHKAVVDLVKEYNLLGRGNVALMLDTKGPEVRSGDLSEPIDMKAGAISRQTANGASNPRQDARALTVHGEHSFWRSMDIACVWFTSCVDTDAGTKGCGDHGGDLTWAH